MNTEESNRQAERERFAEAIWGRCDPSEYVHVRAFYQGTQKSFRPDAWEQVPIPEAAAAAGRLSALAEAVPDAIVVCSPTATFAQGAGAAQADILSAPVLSADLDTGDTDEARARLLEVLGPPTVEVLSGGWSEGTPRRHLHWALDVPAQGADALRQVRDCRRAAALMVKSDTTAQGPEHPLRWPGTPHRKDAPTWARIAPESEDAAALTLAEAVELLTPYLPGERERWAVTPRSCLATPEALAALLARIPNERLPWDAWNTVGLAVWRLSGGADWGRELWAKWSALSDKQDGPTDLARWEHFCKYPPTRAGIGTLRRLAREVGGGEAEALPVLLVDPAAPNGAVEAAVELLGDALFRRGPVACLLDRASGCLEPATPHRLLYRIEQAADVRILKGDGDIPGRLPDYVAKRIIEAAPDLHKMRPCDGLSHVPILRPDGSLFEGPGYDTQTRLWIDPPPGLPPIPERPTQQQALEALERLLAPFAGYLEGYPEGSTDREALRATLAAAALSAIVRPSLEFAPVVLIDANQPRVGKSKLARCLATLVSPLPPAILTEGPDSRETAKRVDAALLGGGPAVILDNLQNPFGCSAVESLATEGLTDIRLLGQSKSIQIRTRGLLQLTANNASIRTDLRARMLTVRLVVRHESPEARRFAWEPVAQVRADRAALVAAGFTVLRAWLLEGIEAPSTLGSFEAWAQLVGGAVWWLTGSDVVAAGIQNRRGADPAVEADARVMMALRFWQAEYRKTAAPGAPAPGFWRAGEVTGVREWREALGVPADEKPSPRQVGDWLRRRQDRTYPGQYLEREERVERLTLLAQPGRDKVNWWTVVGDTPK